MSWSVLFRTALVLILALIIGLVIRSYTAHRTSANSLLQAVDTLKHDNPALHLMDSALVTLNEAESNFRLYTAIYDRNYLKVFGDQMNTVSELLDSAGKPAPGSPHQLESLVRRKSDMADKVAQLKKAADSMLVRSLRDDMLNRMLQSIPPYDASKFKKEEIIRDTVTTGGAAPAKKGLFKRLGNAIANKKDTVNSQMVITVRTKDGSSLTMQEYEARQLRNLLADVNKYYKGVLRRQLEGRMQINSTEHLLAGTNLSLLHDLKDLIEETKTQVRLDETAHKLSAGRVANDSIGDMKLYVILFLLGIAALIALLLGAWYKNRQYAGQLQLESEKALETARARTVFMNNMSHEIRTPLNSIIGFSEQLEHTPLNNEQRDMLNAIDVSSDMLMQVVNDVLDFSKLESDYIVIQKKPFNLYQTIGEVASTMRIQAARKQLAFQLNFVGDQQQQVLGDAFRLKQVLVNLISNAIKYTEKGSVTVTATLKNKKDDQAEMVVSVQDTGPGIKADMLPKIFERYYQARSARLTSKGTGLGLAISRRLVDLHGGEIKVESEVGKGSVFTCMIPYQLVSESQSAGLAHQNTLQEPGSNMEGLNVLVADDQEMNLLLLKMLLTRWKCTFDLAVDGKKAFDLFEANRYDLVLLDLQMPYMSGIDVMEKIRASHDPQKAQVPVLALTADITREDEELFRKAGFNDWVLKPFREKDIYTVIIKHLNPTSSKVSQFAMED